MEGSHSRLIVRMLIEYIRSKLTLYIEARRAQTPAQTQTHPVRIPTASLHSDRITLSLFTPARRLVVVIVQREF